MYNKKGNTVTVTVLDAYKVVTRRGFHTFYTIGSEEAVRLSALYAVRPLPPERSLVRIYVGG